MNLDPKRQLTVEEVRELFSHTDEYGVNDKGDETIEIVYMPEDDCNQCSTRIYQPNLQRILRKLHTLHYNYHHRIFD